MGLRTGRRSRLAVAIAVSAISLGLSQQSALADSGSTGSVLSGTVSAAAVTSDTVSDTTSAAGAAVQDTTSAAGDIISDVSASAPNPGAVASDLVSDSAAAPIFGQAVGGTQGSGGDSVPAEGSADTTSPSQTTPSTSNDGSSTDGHGSPWVTSGLVGEREGGASVLGFAAGGNMARWRESAGLCAAPGGSSPLCVLTLGLNSGSLAGGVASIVRSLAQTGRELLPLMALSLLLAVSGALALGTAGRRSDELSLPTRTVVRTSNA